MSRRSILSQTAFAPRFAWGAALLLAVALSVVIAPILWLIEVWLL